MRLRGLGLLLLVAACGEAGEDGLGPTGTLPPGLVPTTPGTNSPTYPNTGSPNVGVDGGTSSNNGAPSSGLPCDVQAILKDKCQTCHSDPVQGAPFPLVTRAHLLAASTAFPGSKIADRVKARINDTANPMPPSARPQLTAEQKTTLNNYLSGGLVENTASCSTGTTGGDGGTQVDVDVDYLPPDSECEVMMELRAHGGQTVGDTTPYSPPASDTNHYEIFYFKPTWTKKMHVIRIDPLIDNGAILHHWLLYMEDGVGTGDGTHKADSGLQSANSQLLSGWAPGNKSVPLGRDVGMQVIQGPNARFGIEIHYNTASKPANTKDRSGARLCLTSQLRPKEAGTHWLGTQAIFNPFPLGGTYTAGGRCSVQKESHIIAYSPHMHVAGKHAKSIITKKGGGTVTLNDGPFDFDDQQIFPVKTASGAREIVVQPGDTIQTTCSYDGSKSFTFGPDTEEEMCYNFVLAWPVGSLSNGTPGAVGGKNTCIDPGT